jgi:hypothetical protein
MVLPMEAMILLRKLQYRISILLFGLLLVNSAGAASEAIYKELGWKAIGTNYKAYVRVSAAGGFKELYLFRKSEPIFYIKDITSFAINGLNIVYSTGGSYADGGLYCLDMNNEISSKLMGAEPENYYEIFSFDSDKKTIEYSEISNVPSSSSSSPKKKILKLQ